MVKQVSVEEAFQWAQAVALREWRLILPVALTFFALPGLIIDVFLPNAMQALLPSAPVDAAQGQAMLALTAMVVVNMVGALAVSALAVVPGISVAEAIGRAVHRLPALVGAALLVTAALIAGVLVLALLLGVARIDPRAVQGLLLMVILIVGGMLWVRLCLITPILVDRSGAPAAALRLSWQLSAGAFWRLAGALLVYFVGGLVVLVALSSALGAIVTLGARAAGAESVGTILAAILFRGLAAPVSAGVQLLVAGLYRQLTSNGM